MTIDQYAFDYMPDRSKQKTLNQKQQQMEETKFQRVYDANDFITIHAHTQINRHRLYIKASTKLISR